MFVDRVEIVVQGGHGGRGCLSFRREKFIPRGGPDGGDGGHGGSVIARALEGVDNLSALGNQKHWRGEVGGPGGPNARRGRNAEDLVILVPPGTLIYDSKTGLLLKDLTRSGDEVVIAQGGRGGFGNQHFKTSTNRAPRIVTAGLEGENKTLLFELKVIADVGLIGKPNAGKSTLLSRLSRARPEIASYPFTTKHPNLGLVHLDQDRSFVMADIPGLIEGASQGLGLGHEFLRHIERAGILVHLVEPQPADDTDPLHNYDAIHEELRLYSAEVGSRPEIVVVSKQDLPEGKEVREKLEARLGRPVLGISAVTGEGLNRLISAVAQALAAAKPAGPKLAPPLRPQDRPVPTTEAVEPPAAEPA